MTFMQAVWFISSYWTKGSRSDLLRLQRQKVIQQTNPCSGTTRVFFKKNWILLLNQLFLISYTQKRQLLRRLVSRMCLKYISLHLGAFYAFYWQSFSILNNHLDACRALNIINRHTDDSSSGCPINEAHSLLRSMVRLFWVKGLINIAQRWLIYRREFTSVAAPEWERHSWGKSLNLSDLSEVWIWSFPKKVIGVVKFWSTCKR